MQRKNMGLELCLCDGLIEDAIRGKGEDAVSSALDVAERTVMIACMDGCGGSGGRLYNVNGPLVTGARIASFEVGEAVKQFFLDSGLHTGADLFAQYSTLQKQLHTAIDARLGSVRTKLNGGGTSGGGLKNRLAAELPTTLAMIIAQQKDYGIDAATLWAGDSRTYLLTEYSGLQQWSTDDIVGGADAQENAERDGIMSNAVCADGKYTINMRTMTVATPCIFLTATDGSFAYFSSPVMFEGVLLETMRQARTPYEWMGMLRQKIGTVAGDDRSLQLAVFDYPGTSFGDIKRRYEARYQAYVEKHGQLFWMAGADAHKHWEQYRVLYEALQREERETYNR